MKRGALCLHKVFENELFFKHQCPHILSFPCPSPLPPKAHIALASRSCVYARVPQLACRCAYTCVGAGAHKRIGIYASAGELDNTCGRLKVRGNEFLRLRHKVVAKVIQGDYTFVSDENLTTLSESVIVVSHRQVRPRAAQKLGGD